MIITAVIGFTAPEAFDAWLSQLRDAWQALPPPRVFYMVAFHPRLTTPPDRALTPDSLVSLLRRSPDPVIQCVDGEVLDRVRRQAQVAARERIIKDLAAKDPELAALFERSVSPDPELSSDIAKTNFKNLGDAPGRARLEAAITEIHAARAAAYGEAL